ncbi:MAG: uracil-DNA glycosylase [Bowdeniella nasicola]|nr:uracil-DNA glycosylase [Bowdeniella nasicola]
MTERLPHPVTGELFASPVPPGAGWPGDPATTDTAVATTPAQVEELAAACSDTAALDAAVSVCRACERLVAWREEVALTKRASFAGEPYWGRPVASFGNPSARRLIVGLAPAAHGANRTGRMFTGDRSADWIVAALHRAGLASQETSLHAGDGLRLTGARMVAPVHCAPPANKPTAAERATCSPWLRRELDLVRPVALLALGGIAWQSVLRVAREADWQVPRPAPRFAHGARASLEAPWGAVALFGCYHVSQHNTFTGRLTREMLLSVVAEFAAA